MENKGKIAILARVATHAEAADLDLDYYANVTWKVNATHVEDMRRYLWSKEYAEPIKRESLEGRKRSIYSEEYDFE